MVAGGGVGLFFREINFTKFFVKMIFCGSQQQLFVYTLFDATTTTTNPDETSLLLIFYICRLLKEFFLIWRRDNI